MDYTTLTVPTGWEAVPEPVALASLYEALQTLPDLRRAQGKRYSLELILCLIVLAKLAGQKTAAVERPNGFDIAPLLWLSPLGCAERPCLAR